MRRNVRRFFEFDDVPIGTVAAGSFTPLSVSDVLFWVTGDSFAAIANGTPIDTWEDQSANGYDFISGGAARPTVFKPGLNGLPGADFDPTSNQGMMGPAGLIAEFVGTDLPLSVVAVFKSDEETTTRTILAAGVNASTNNRIRYLSSNGAGLDLREQRVDGAASTGNVDSSGNEATAVAMMVAWINNGTATVIRKNGTQVGVGALNVGAITPTGVGLGITPNTTAPFNGQIYEVVAYSRNITLAETQQIEEHFADKYGIALP